MGEDAVPKRQRTTDEMYGAAGSVHKKMEVEKENQVMKDIEVTKPAASPKLSPQVV